MKNQLSLAIANVSGNPNAGKIISVAVVVTLVVIGLLAPGAIAFAGPIDGGA
jgi:hypothetical protein